MTVSRDLDIVVYGATGFVGRLTAAYLAENLPDGVAVGLAGRSRTKLEKLAADLGTDWRLIEANADDPASLTALAESTRVVITTVGPYATYGLPLVQACAEAGTDYVDLTGEVLFHRESIDRFDDVARRTGAASSTRAVSTPSRPTSASMRSTAPRRPTVTCRSPTRPSCSAPSAAG